MMKEHSMLEEPSAERQDEFLAAVARSRKLHRHWARPPRTAKEFKENLKRLQNGAHIAYWVCSENGELAGVININEIVRGVFCSGDLVILRFRSAQWTWLYEAGALRRSGGSISSAATTPA